MSFLPTLKERTSAGTSRIVVLQVFDRDDPKVEVAAVVVEAVEVRVHDSEGQLRSASLDLYYERICPQGMAHLSGTGRMAGGYNSQSNHVCLLRSSPGGEGGFFLGLPRLEGQRIGTYLLNRAVAWVKQWPAAAVDTIRLDRGQGTGDNKERRNQFYEQFKIAFDYEDQITREAGLSRPMKACELETVDTWTKNIRELSLEQYLANLTGDYAIVSAELGHRDRAVKDLVEESKARERHPVFWALGYLVQQWWTRVLPVALLAGLGALAYFRSA